MLGLENLASNDAMTYYRRELPAWAPEPKGYFTSYDALRAKETQAALEDGRRVYVVSSPPVNPTDLYPQVFENCGEVVGEQQWGGAYPVQVNTIAGTC